MDTEKNIIPNIGENCFGNRLRRKPRRRGEDIWR